MASITAADVRAYIAKRQAETIVVQKARRVKKRAGWLELPEVRRPVSAGEINRELTALKRMFSLAKQAGKLLNPPYIPMLKEDNVRTGFFEREQFDTVMRYLPEPIRPVVVFAYYTGWRIASEVLPLQWRQVDRQAGEVRLDAGTTKNDEGRMFAYAEIDELRDLIEERWAAHRALAAKGRISPYVFHGEVKSRRTGATEIRPIKAFTKAWSTACRMAGCPGRIPHDLRRTAVRNLIRAGVPDSVAMKITGHKTRSVFERYNITSKSDLTEAARKLNAASTLAKTKAEAEPEVMG
jgi:integrase